MFVGGIIGMAIGVYVWKPILEELKRNEQEALDQEKESEIK